MNIIRFHVQPLSMIPRADAGKQRVDFICESDFTGYLYLSATRGGVTLADNMEFPVQAGVYVCSHLFPAARQAEQSCWRLTDAEGRLVAEYECLWEVPRNWTFYAVVSSHTDIGLHNSPYIQRYNSSRFLEMAMELAKKTSDRPEENRYRYALEGTWVWGNYGADRGRRAAQRVVRDYINQGTIAVGCGAAGNHTQVYGLEEMCRSSYSRKRLEEDWKIHSSTMTMIDNNGMSWALVNPYVSAGIRNVFFAPNQWNPLPSTIFQPDYTKMGRTWNPAAGGGGARIDVRYDSSLPMVFYWQGADEQSRLLVWASTQYGWGGSEFGIYTKMRDSMSTTLENVASRMGVMLPKLERRYPYDVWLFGNYNDDQEPSAAFLDFVVEWNKVWQFPTLRLVGNFDEPFDRIRAQWDTQIPVLCGDITGGWYQHPVATPELLAEKFAADRLLPTAEKIATVACLCGADYTYPATAFQRAWDALIWNDEHSYGTSGYQGRRVYETWMQHRDWIAKARETAETEASAALHALAEKIDTPEDSVLLFNPTMFARRELLFSSDGAGRKLSPEVPSFGWQLVPERELVMDKVTSQAVPEPPLIENNFYRLAFTENGSIGEIFDKQLQRSILDATSPCHANEFVFTEDNHRSFASPEQAVFTVETCAEEIIVRAEMAEPVSGAAIVQTVRLHSWEKRIDICNELSHVRGLVNRNRYYRYGYYAFPFLVEDAKRIVHLNGCKASPGFDQTGHGTDTYLAGREWSCVENGKYGVALLQLDSHLVEFGRIHPDKTDYGHPESGSAIFSYICNDWLQMHTPGGSHVNFVFRYAIVSYPGDHIAANIARMAERLANPLLSVRVKAHKGTLPGCQSLLECPSDNMRLLALKRSDNGRGVVARLLETFGQEIPMPCLRSHFQGKANPCPVTVDERPTSALETCPPFGYCTWLLAGSGWKVAARPEESVDYGDCPAPIGAVYTGLITTPRAACGEKPGQLYLLWGQNTESDLSHYELHRSRKPGFRPGKSTFLAAVEPGDYRVGRYEDTGLKTHTVYYYRVRAVNKADKTGPWSDVFSGVTREEL